MTAREASTAFYLSPCRFWELMSGGLLSYLSSSKFEIIEKLKPRADYWLNKIIYEDKSLNYNSKDLIILKNVASILGFLINILSIIFIKKISGFPGKWALYPMIGTVLIIAAGPNSWANKKILSNKVMVWFGLISYPLYLWHWPILSYASILEGGILKIKVIWTSLTLSVLLGWLTYRFIERPVRSSRGNKLIVLFLSLGLLSLGVLSHQIYENKGYPLRHANKVQAKIINPYDDGAFLDTNHGCESLFGQFSETASRQSNNLCQANSDNPEFLVIGDSHATGLSYSAIKHKKLDIISLAIHGTLPLTNYFTNNSYINKDEIRERHSFFVDYGVRAAKLSDVKYIVLLTRGPVYFSGKGFGIEELSPDLAAFKIEHISGNAKNKTSQEASIEGYVETINALLALGKKVIFAIDHPELGFDPHSCVKRPITITNKFNRNCYIERSAVDERQKEYRELIAKIKKRVPSLIIYDPIDLFCDSKKCYAEKDNKILYCDDDHLSGEGSKILLDDFLKWLEKNNLK